MIRGLYEAHLPVSDMDASVAFYEKLGLEVYDKTSRVTFLWIEQGKSQLGLWKSDHVSTPYHPSIRHIAFYVSLDDLRRSQKWLNDNGLEVRDAFGVAAKDQPLVLKNSNNYHAAIYFYDPDGNSLELISPLKLDDENTVNYEDKMTLSRWLELNSCIKV